MEPVNLSSEANVKCRAQRTQEMAQYCLDVLQRLSVVLTQADFATIESEIEARPGDGLLPLPERLSGRNG